MEKIENYINLAQKIDNVIYSNSFYPISQIKKIQKLYHKEIDLVFKGLNEGSEKNILAFFPKNYSKEYINFPIKFFKILKKSKFISLEHKNYLGSILAMGLKREILGDLLVKDEVCYG
ncbi:MAG: RNA-binding protein, partial [Fusobacterium sp.]|nr:RNA-binding protein [Fusobacterium sp.]